MTLVSGENTRISIDDMWVVEGTREFAMTARGLPQTTLGLLCALIATGGSDQLRGAVRGEFDVDCIKIREPGVQDGQ